MQQNDLFTCFSHNLWGKDNFRLRLIEAKLQYCHVKLLGSNKFRNYYTEIALPIKLNREFLSFKYNYNCFLLAKLFKITRLCSDIN